MSLKWPPKDPGETLDYDIDWTSRLNGTTITGSTWSVNGTSLVTSNPTNSTTMTKVTLSGGTLNQTYTLLNTITTALNGTMVERVTIKIKQK